MAAQLPRNKNKKLDFGSKKKSGRCWAGTLKLTTCVVQPDSSNVALPRPAFQVVCRMRIALVGHRLVGDDKSSTRERMRLRCPGPDISRRQCRQQSRMR